MSAFRSIMVWLGLSSPPSTPSGEAEYFLPGYEKTRLLASAEITDLDADPAAAWLAAPYMPTMRMASAQPTHYLEPE